MAEVDMARKLGQVSPTQPVPENDDVEETEGNFPMSHTCRSWAVVKVRR